MLCDRLSCSKAAGDDCRAAFCHREKRIDNARPCDQRITRCQASLIGSGLAHRPALRQWNFQSRDLLIPSGLKNRHNIFDAEITFTDIHEAAAFARRNKDAMLDHSRFLYHAKLAARPYSFTNFEGRSEMPERIFRERGGLDATRDKFTGLE